jgi:hypothetical protein
VRAALRTAVLASLAAACACVPRVDYRLTGVAVTPFGVRTQDASAAFAKTFCGTLTHLDPQHTEWGSCTRHLEAAAADEPPLPDQIPAGGLGVLVVGGIFSHCFENRGIFAFAPALKHLEDAHGITTHRVTIDGLGTPADNAARIDAYLRRHPGRYIAVGHSKGAVDLMTAIQHHQSAKDQIVALVSVAGAIAGSRLMDYPMSIAKAGFQAAARQAGLGRCPIDSDAGMKNLRRERRYEFLSEWSPPASLRSYSLVGVVPEKRTSTVLRGMWRRLQYYSIDQDSQMIAEEAIIPGADFLGVARGDHWALALPFSEHADRAVRLGASENHFPRTALLEGIVRHVLAGKAQP